MTDQPLPKPQLGWCAAHLLEQAAAVIRRDGWCQGRLSNYRGAVCLLGAVYKASSQAAGVRESFAACQARRAVERAALGALEDSIDGTDPARVALWNDARGRTKRDVVRRLLEVARG